MPNFSIDSHSNIPPAIQELQKKILAFLARYPNELFKSKELSRRLGIRSEKEYESFKLALRELQDSRKINRSRGKQFGHLFVSEDLEGIFELTRAGFGLVTIDQTGEQLYIAPDATGDAMTRDRVRVAIIPQSAKKKEKGARREGEVVKIIDRGRKLVVGTLDAQRSNYFVVPDEMRGMRNITVEKKSLRTAKTGDKVVVKMEFWGNRTEYPSGLIEEVLGKAGELSAEIRSVVKEFQLPESFPAEVLEEASEIDSAIPEAEIRRRRDLRDWLCITIDPIDAKDFDDAVSLITRDDGNFLLGVHIADVSYYVREHTPLDKEALKRSTSVYFPNGVIPMLPEKLSNELCSLRPNEDRLTFSILIVLSPHGVVKEYEIVESIIHSKRRFSYEEIQVVIDGKNEKPSEAVLASTVREMQKLSSVLTKKRMKEGSIDFESAEAKFVLDEQGKPLKIVKKVRMESHRLVEEFMLLANMVVAKHAGLAKKEEHAKPFLYRIHDSPDPDRIQELALFVERFGFKLNLDSGVTSKALQRLLEQVKGTEVENVINEITLRSMAKAIYSDRNIGHFGLSFPYYSHFTSPIRRYPDLVIHRLLKQYAAGISVEERNVIRQRLPFVAKQSSDMERRAMEAERAATKVMQVEYMKRHLGDEFQAVISGVTRFGMFVEINDLLTEGMVHVRDMQDDYFEYDERHYALIGKRGKTQYRLGDTVSVKVVRVNTEERKIDFILV